MKFKHHAILLASALTFISTAAVADVYPQGCKSLAYTNWYGNVSSDTGRMSRKIYIQIKEVMLNTTQGPDYYYQLIGTINGRPLNVSESTCWEDGYEQYPKMVRVNFVSHELGMDLVAKHPLPTQMPISGLLKKDERGNQLRFVEQVDGMIMKN